MLRRLLLAASLTVSADAAAQAASYFDGPLVYTPAVDFVTGYMPNGTGYYLSQAYIPSPPQPTVGQGFYVRVTMSGIASPAAGRLMALHFIPPAGTTILVDPVNAPVVCTYRAMNGTGSYANFTSTPIVDQSFGANLRIFGCPQPAAGGTPYPVSAVPGGNAYRLDRRDPQNPNAPLWPLGSQASYQIYIPLVAQRTMNGFAEGDRAYAPIRSIQGDGIDPWTFPYVALLVAAAPGSVAADVAASEFFPPPPPPPGRTSTTIRCTNNGPNPATNVTCGFTNLPPQLTNPTTNCSQSMPIASLAVGASVVCSVVGDAFFGNATVTGVAASANADGNLGNNSVTLNLSGRLIDPVFNSGFETP